MPAMCNLDVTLYCINKSEINDFSEFLELVTILGHHSLTMLADALNDTIWLKDKVEGFFLKHLFISFLRLCLTEYSKRVTYF